MEPAQVEAIRIANRSFGLEGTLWEQYLGFMRRAHHFRFWPIASHVPHAGVATDLTGASRSLACCWLRLDSMGAWEYHRLTSRLHRPEPTPSSSKALQFWSIHPLLHPRPDYDHSLLRVGICHQLQHVAHAKTVTLDYVWAAIYNSILPALSIVIANFGWWFLSMKALSSTS